MRFNNTEDDDKEDLYESFEPEEPKKPKEPEYRPDDPRYWDNDEDEWEHLRPTTRWRRVLLWTAAACIAAAAGWLAWRLVFAPYSEDAVQYGYVETVELRGDLFKTYEGVLLPYKNLHDTTRMYREDFTFSTSGKLGKTMREFQNSGRPLRVEYRTYRHAFPWRGEQKRVVVRVDTVNPDSIIPADWLRPH